MAGLRSPHEPVTRVVDVPHDAPPPGDEELCSALGGHSLQMGNRRVRGVLPELVLLAVGAPEYPVAEDLQEQNGCHLDGLELLRVREERTQSWSEPTLVLGERLRRSN